MIGVESLIRFVIYLIVVGLVWYLLNWLIDYAGVPDPFAKVARVLLAVVAVLILISALLSLTGGAGIVVLH